MKPHGTLKVMAIIVAVYVAALLPALVWDGYLDSPVGLLVAFPYLSVYLFHSLGVPGLLQQGGACGWGWCRPTLFGWAFIATFWLALAWIAARSFVHLRSGGARGR
jgi:hypothetical protein